MAYAKDAFGWVNGGKWIKWKSQKSSIS
jgi:hypothetical protein